MSEIWYDYDNKMGYGDGMGRTILGHPLEHLRSPEGSSEVSPESDVDRVESLDIAEVYLPETIE